MQTHHTSSLSTASQAAKKWLATTFNAYHLEVTPREFCSITSLYGAMRHFNAVCILVEGNAYASAFALLRVLWQALLNGAWLYAACPDEMLEPHFIGSRDFPKIPRLVKEIEAKLEHEMVDAKAFTEFQVRIGTFMHNHTHAGHRQIHSLFNQTTITESFTPHEVNVLLFIATRMAFMAAALFALVVGDNQLELEVRDRLIEFSEEFDQGLAREADAPPANT